MFNELSDASRGMKLALIPSWELNISHLVKRKKSSSKIAFSRERFVCGRVFNCFIGFFTGEIQRGKLNGILISYKIWLVVSTHLKNISQIGHLSQIGVQKKNI